MNLHYVQLDMKYPNYRTTNIAAMPTSLYDIPSLPDSVLKQKYISTDDVYDDPLTIENFMREAMRDRRSDKPIYESEMPRNTRNAGSNALLSMQEYGSRYSHDPYHPELFLGDLSKDPRVTDTAPIVANMGKQNKFRYEKYMVGKLQDNTDPRNEGMVGSKRMLKQIKAGFGDTATRMGGLFDDSSDTIVARANPHPNYSIHKVTDTIQEDQQIYQTEDERILPKYGTNIVSKLSNMVGVQWDVQPDMRFGLSSVSNVYRSKGEVDQAANAVFRLGKQDANFGSEKQRFTSGMQAQQVDLIKAARLNAQTVRVDINTDSTKTKKTDKMMIPPTHQSAVRGFNGTQSTKEQMQDRAVFFKYVAGTKRTETLVEPINAKTVIDHTRATTIPNKDRIGIVYKINQTHKNVNNREDLTGKRTLGLRALARAFVARSDVHQEQLVKAGYQNRAITNGIPTKNVEHVSKAKLSKNKTTSKLEQLQNNPTGTTTLPVTKSTDDFKFDIDPTMNNNYQTRSGVSQSSHLRTPQQDQDSTISPLNDTVAPMRTKYTI